MQAIVLCGYCPKPATDYFELPDWAVAAGSLLPDDKLVPVCDRHLVLCTSKYQITRST